MAFLDLSAAFDTVYKEILLNRLSTTFGIHCGALKWFRSYLTNRTEYILFNGVKSPVRNVTHDVPQGSVRSVVVFVIHSGPL